MDNDEFKKFMNQDFKSFSDALFSLNAYEFTLLGTVIGFAISPLLTTNQQNSLGNFFDLVGQVLMTVNAQNITLAQAKRKNKNINPNFNTGNINEELYNMKNELNKMIDELYGNK